MSSTVETAIVSDADTSSASESERNKNKRNYNKAAWFYEQASTVYSAGQIRKAKAAQIAHIQPGQSISYLGVGTGEDAVMAAKKGARVTCIDLSSSMIKRAQQKMSKAGVTAELIVGDVKTHSRIGHYDVVATNFFLNCFREKQMQEMMQLAIDFIRPEGRLMLADVALSQGNPLSKMFNIAYLKFGMISFWSLGLVPLHRNYDYPKYFSELGMRTEATEYFRFLKKGPVLFQNIVARKN